MLHARNHRVTASRRAAGALALAIAAAIALDSGRALAQPATPVPPKGAAAVDDTRPAPEPTKKDASSDDLGAAGKGNANDGGGGALGGPDAADEKPPR